MRSQYPQLSKQPKEKTSGRLDVKVRAKDGTLFNVEVQLEKKNYFIDREFFTLRQSHPDIVQPIRFAYSKKPEEIASEKIWICNIELPKFKASYQTLDDIEAAPKQERDLLRWLYILTEGYLSKEETDMLADETEGMANFADLYNRAIADQDLRDWYEYEQSVILEENSRRREEEERQKRLKAIEEKTQKLQKTVEKLQKVLAEKQRTVEEQQKAVEKQQRTVEERARELKERELAILEQEKRLAELQKQLEATQK